MPDLAREPRGAARAALAQERGPARAPAAAPPPRRGRRADRTAAVRILFWFLLLAAAAVGVALATRITAGYALFVAPPYRVELSLNLLLLLVVGGFAGGYALVRHRAPAMRPAGRGARGRRRQQQERARARARRGRRRAARGSLRPRSRSSPRKRWRFRSRRGWPRWSPRARRSKRAISMSRRRCWRAPDAAGAQPRRAAAHARGRDEARRRGSRREALARLQALRKEAGAHRRRCGWSCKRLQARRPLRRHPAAGRPAGEAQGATAPRKARTCAPSRTPRCSASAATIRRACAATGTGCPTPTSGMPRIARGGRPRASWPSGAIARRRTSSPAASTGGWEPDCSRCCTRSCRPAEPTRQLEQAEQLAEGAQPGRDAAARAGHRSASGSSSGARRRPISRRASRSTVRRRTHVALGELLARLGRNEEATRTSPRRSSSRWPSSVTGDHGAVSAPQVSVAACAEAKPGWALRGHGQPGFDFAQHRARGDFGGVGEAVGEELVGRQAARRR